MNLEDFCYLKDARRIKPKKMENPFELTECEIEMIQNKYRNLIDEVMSMMAKNRP